MLTASLVGIDQHLLVMVAVAVVFSVLLATCSALQRQPYVLVLGFILAGVAYWQSFAGFLLVNAIAYAVVRWLGGRTNAARRWQWTCVLLAALIVIFTAGRLLHWEERSLLPGTLRVALYSLDMWLLLRLVTLFWEVGSGAQPAPPVSQFLLWATLPLTLSGPVLRYSQLPANIVADRAVWRSSAWWLGLGAGACKLMAGFGLAVVPAMMSRYWTAHPSWPKALTALISGPWGFYLTYAGYFQLMEVLGRSCGFPLPPSFNVPFGRENISAFWANWNMSATNVFRDYLFFNRWGFSTYNAYLNTMIVFVLVGLWHAANAYWLLWGFLHGLLFCTYMVWRRYAKPFIRLPFQGTMLSRAGAAALTYVCVCACWYVPSKILQRIT
jgi:D-alanyl-lipoteichoic acid acyltransferase DltB (MBOAT superfamily)